MVQIYIVRHRKENKKKCSLEPLKENPNLQFISYPLKIPFDFSNTLLLDFEGPLLTARDVAKPLVLLDATWKKAEVMKKELFKKQTIECRSLPKGFLTAYPRRQDDCKEPEKGLASVEALYVAYRIFELDASSILKSYYWKEIFLTKNRELLEKLFH